MITQDDGTDFSTVFDDSKALEWVCGCEVGDGPCVESVQAFITPGSWEQPTPLELDMEKKKKT